MIVFSALKYTVYIGHFLNERFGWAVVIMKVNVGESCLVEVWYQSPELLRFFVSELNLALLCLQKHVLKYS